MNGLLTSLLVLQLGSHTAQFDEQGRLLPWTTLSGALDREMNWYLKCPVDHGYPRFATLTFMNGDYTPAPDRQDFIPAMQNGMGIISYLQYDEFTHRSHPQVIEWARAQAAYLIDQSLTPDEGRYPRFPRSTAKRQSFPQAPDCGAQSDHPFEIQPDKGGIAGYALALLSERTGDPQYLAAALHIAQTLTANMRPADATHSPWPFRADWRSGAPRGEVSGNMTYILRLFDFLIAHGHDEFLSPRNSLWAWIRNFQIPSAAHDGRLFAQFFEDHDNPSNRTSWAPLNLARYLIEKKTALDPNWRQDSLTLIEFVNRQFTSVRFGVAVCGEQDEDRDPWGGANSTWAAVLAMYSAATGDPQFKSIAHQALILISYAIDDDGCPRDMFDHRRGGWQEDAHTDVVHNFIDAFQAFPEWAQ